MEIDSFEFSDFLPLKKYLWNPQGQKQPSDLLEVFIELLSKATEIICHLKIDFVTFYFHAEIIFK